MIRINLLPHREERKAAHRRRFQILAGLSVSSAVLLVGLGYLWFDYRITHQQQRNEHLQQAISKLDEEIRKIEGLRKERDQLLARKQLVEKLQQSRGDATRVFDQLIRQTPEGVYITAFEQKGAQFHINGYALSGARVSNYMRTLAESSVFHAPVLEEVKAAVVNNQRVNAFSLNLSTKPVTNAPASTGGATQ